MMMGVGFQLEVGWLGGWVVHEDVDEMECTIYLIVDAMMAHLEMNMTAFLCRRHDQGSLYICVFSSDPNPNAKLQ